MPLFYLPVVEFGLEEVHLLLGTINPDCLMIWKVSCHLW